MKIGKTLEEMGLSPHTPPQQTCVNCKKEKSSFWIDERGWCDSCTAGRQHHTERLTINALYVTIAFIPIVIAGVVLWWLL